MAFSLPAVSGRGPVGGVVVVGLAAAALLALPGATIAGPGSRESWAAGTYDTGAEAELVARTEATRQDAGDAALVVDPVLTDLARWRSRDMVERGYFSHDIPDIGNVFRRLDANGYCYELAGENIGWDTDADDAAPAAIHEMFLASPEHRDNIVEARWDAIGVGAFKAADGGKMWTVLFADRCGCAPARGRVVRRRAGAMMRRRGRGVDSESTRSARTRSDAGFRGQVCSDERHLAAERTDARPPVLSCGPSVHTDGARSFRRTRRRRTTGSRRSGMLDSPEGSRPPTTCLRSLA